MTKKPIQLGEERDALKRGVESVLGTATPRPAAPAAPSAAPRTVVPPPKPYTPTNQTGPSWNTPDYLTLGGHGFDKRTTMRILNEDLPRLLLELQANKTVRARFLNIAVAPLVREYNGMVMQNKLDLTPLAPTEETE
jgi:hypothetical protein